MDLLITVNFLRCSGATGVSKSRNVEVQYTFTVYLTQQQRSTIGIIGV